MSTPLTDELCRAAFLLTRTPPITLDIPRDLSYTHARFLLPGFVISRMRNSARLIITVSRRFRWVGWDDGQVMLDNSRAQDFSDALESATPPNMQIIFTVAVLINLQGCVMWFVATCEGLEDSWVAHISSKSTYLPDASGFVQWLMSCYWALTTISTIG